MNYSDREYLIELGRKIAEERRRLNYTQGDLAGLANMEISNLSVIETGKSNPQILTLIRISSALECNLSDLLPEFDEPKSFLDIPGEYEPRQHIKLAPSKPVQRTPPKKRNYPGSKK